MAKKKGKGLKKACWKGYEAIGMKKKGGRMVPNCVPITKKVKSSPAKIVAAIAPMVGKALVSLSNHSLSMALATSSPYSGLSFSKSLAI